MPGSPTHRQTKPRRKLPEQVRVNAILDAALQCFGKNGYALASVDQIADAAGLTKGGIYFHFKNKEAVFQALVRRIYDLRANFYQGPQNVPNPDAFQEIERIWNRYLELAVYLERNQIPVRRILYDSWYHPATRSIIAQAYQDFHQHLTKLIRRAQKDKTLRRELKPAAAATMFMAVIDGLYLLSDLDQFEYGEAGDRLFRWTLNALRP